MSTRTRSTDRRTTSSYIRRAYSPYGSAPPYTGDAVVSVNTVGEVVTITDESHPNYYARKRKGEIIMGPCSITKQSRTMSPGYVTGYVPEWEETWVRREDLITGVEGNPGLPVLPDTSGDVSRMRDTALIKAHAKMNSSSIMGGEILGTIGRTVGMFKHPFKSATELVGKILTRKGRLLNKSGSNALQASASAWLEYRYGWKPVLYDCQAIVKDVHKLRERGTGRLVARSGASSNNSFNGTFSNMAGVGNWYTGFRYTGTVVSEYEMTAAAGIMYEVTNRTTSDNLLRLLGLRTADIPATVWELVPFSFVLDWFVGVGDWLQAITPDPNIRTLGSWATYTIMRRKTYNVPVCTYPAGSTVQTGNGGQSIISTFNFVREINPSIPTYPVSTTGPLSITHQTDAIALLAQQIVGSLRRI